MAQTAAIAPALTAGTTSADISIPAFENWLVGIYTDDANGFQALLNEQSIIVYIDTPSSADTIECVLTRNNPVVQIPGKCTIRLKRPAQPAGSVNIGAFLNDNT